MHKLRLLANSHSLKSQSLKLLATGLSTTLGYKVYRSDEEKPKAINLKYGQGVDKLTQYKWFIEQGIPCFEFTTDKQVAKGWSDQGYCVFARHLLNASCGDGIEVIEPGCDQVPFAPLFTKYKKKKREFRVHVFNDKVVSITEKRRRTDVKYPEADTRIRNLANGYVFCQNVENVPEALGELAIKAAGVSPSAFRGVDIGYNEHNKELFVIEVNSAPGIMGSNVGKYIEEIVKYVQA